MASTPLISVIVPVYKTEQFLDKCLQSLAKQSFKNFEVLCINDCSPDDSAAILERWAKKDSRFRVIDMSHNQGLGAVRNRGIREARAKYIASVDSDDWVEPNFLQTAYDGTENGEHDIVCFGYRRVDETGKVISNHSYPPHFKKTDQIENIFRTFNPAFWNKLWDKSLYLDNNIFFPGEIYGQDMATTPRILTKAKSINFLNTVSYNYLIRGDSATFTFDAKHYVDYILAFDIIQKFLKENGIWEEYKHSFITDIVTQGLRFHSENLLQSDVSEDRRKEYLRHLLLLREAYVKHNDHLSDLDESQLVHLIGDDLAVANIMPEDEREVIPVSCIVKSFLRPKALERLLRSIGEVQDSQNLIFDEVLVADDSPNVDKADVHRAIRKAQYHHENLRIRFIDLGEHVGVSRGRNRLVEESCNETILLCDDDFILDNECQLRDALHQFENSELEIMGGWLKNNYNFKDGSWKYWGVCGTISENPRAKIYQLDERPQRGLVRSDYLLQFFFAKRTTLMDCPWCPELSTEEHPEFFYRLWKRKTPMALSEKLFVKHTGDRRENPARYNEYRHGKEHWKMCLHKSIDLCGKTVRRMYRWQEDEFRIWEVDIESDTNKQKKIPLCPPILDQKVALTRITPRFSNYSFGYYDVRSASADGRYILAQSVPVLDQLPDPLETSKLVKIDRLSGNTMEIIGTSAAWCHQQLSQLQFIPDGTDRIIYNTFDEAKQQYHAVLVDPAGKSETQFDAPIAALRPDGKQAVSLNFSRLFDYRPGYGYSNRPDLFAEAVTPEDDGLWTIDLVSGQKQLVLSYQRIAEELDPKGKLKDRKWVINHAQYSPNGSRVFLLIRPFSDTPPYPTYSVVYDFTTDTLERVFGFGSHYHWKDDDVIAISGSVEMEREAVSRSFGVFEVNVVSGESKALPPAVFKADGHCSYSPDRSMLLYDGYSNTAFPYRALYVYDLKIGRLVTLGYFWSAPELTGNNVDTRCDLHPRWSPDGKTITFDSTHEGFRGIYSIDVDEIRRVIDTNLASMTIADWRAWYSARKGRLGSNAKKGTAAGGLGSVNLSESDRDRIERYITMPKRLPRHGRLLTLLNTLNVDRLFIKLYKRLFLRTNASIALLAGLKDPGKK